MQVTLSDNKLYRLSFKHEYLHLFDTVESELITNEKGKIIGMVDTKVLVTKIPVTTHAFLSEINPADGKRLFDEPNYQSTVKWNMEEDDCVKEKARRYALTKLILTVSNPEDRRAIDDCYTHRRTNQPIVKPVSNVTVQ